MLISTHYRQRIKRKYTKYKENYGVFLSVLRIILYILRDLLNHFLVTLVIKSKSNRNQSNSKRILFLEPRQQGYGDLIFQTPIFEALNRAGYEITIVIQEKHYPILENNPYISDIHYWKNIRGTAAPKFCRFDYVVFLGRNTLKETLLGIKIRRAKKIILDQNLDAWRSAFSDNHTVAWQKLMIKFFNPNLKFGKPKIYTRNKFTLQNTKIINIAVMVGIEKKEKTYPKMQELLNLLLENYPNFQFYLLGQCNKEYSSSFRKFDRGNIVNLVNKQTYSEVIESISKMSAAIGTEGSLIHVSSTLGIPTVVIEIHDYFWKYSNLDKIGPIQVVSGNSPPEEILKTLNKFL